MTTEEITCFVPRNIKVIKEIMECSDSKQFLVINNKITSNYIYKSANTQTQSFVCLQNQLCTFNFQGVFCFHTETHPCITIG